MREQHFFDVTPTEGDAEFIKKDWREQDNGVDCVQVFAVHQGVRR